MSGEGVRVLHPHDEILLIGKDTRMIFEKRIISFYKQTLLKRHDPDGCIFYFSKSDFDGLESESFSFTGDRGQRLAGEIYYRGKLRTDRLIIFEHGMGCGHVAYMREIDLITRHGYTVVTYDHTGTRLSGGEHIGGFSQSLCDLEHCIGAIRADERFKSSSLSVIGHSWGGFSAMNSPAICPEITHTVAISGFISSKEIQDQVFCGPLKLYRKAAYEAELEDFPKHAKIDAVSTLKNSNTKALIIHSRDDETVSYERHFMKLEAAMGGNERVQFLTLDGKRHNPTYTEEAVAYKSEFSAEMKRRNKKNELVTDEAKAKLRDSYDWYKMTDQDEELWDKIFEFLEN